MCDSASGRKLEKVLYKNVEDALNTRLLKEKKTVFTCKDVFWVKVKEQADRKKTQK